MTDKPKDPEATDPRAPTPAERYLRAEGWFDRHVAEPLTGSRWTLAVLAVSHALAAGLGGWIVWKLTH